MKTVNNVLPEEVTPLGVPIVLLDTTAQDFNSPEEFARELERQLMVSHTRVVQFHLHDHTVQEIPAGSLDLTLPLIWSQLQAHHGYAIGLPADIPPEPCASVYEVIDADTQATLRDSWHPTVCAGVNELVHAMEAGTALLRINLAAHTHRRQEIARVVAEIVARRPYPGETDYGKIRDAAVATLRRIDALLAQQAEIRQTRLNQAA